MKLGHKGMILVAVPLACELLFIGTLYGLLKEVERERASEAHAQAVAAHMNKLLRAVIYAGAITSGDALSRRRMRALKGSDPLDDAPNEFKTLLELAKDDPDQTRRIHEIETLVYETVDDLKEIKSLTGEGQTFQAIFDLKHFSQLVNKIGAKVEIVIRDSEVIEKDQTRSQERTRAVVQRVLWLGVILNVLLAVGLAVYFNRGTTRRLAVLVDNTMRLAGGKTLVPAVGGDDEIAYLDKVFRDTAKALAESELSKRELMAMITHDLRSPLAAVQAVLELLSMGVYGEQTTEAVEHLGLAEDNVVRVLRLINDLLDIEKMRAGRLNMEIESTPLADVIKRSSEAVKTLAAKREVRIEAEETNASVNADAGRVTQVLINLLSNAIKYTPDKGTIVIGVKDLDEHAVEVSVTDTGCGIAPEYHETIFEKFEQASSAEIGQMKGTGLGLAICKAIVEQHGGTIGVRSELGEGSTFWFTLTRAAAASEALVAAAIQNPADRGRQS
jgi:signal transduction histidine kinase